MITKKDFTAVKNGMYGQPRAVCHFTFFLTEEENGLSIDERYAIACARALKIGGKRYTGYDYDGGIAFQSYNLHDVAKKINEAMDKVVRYKYTMPDGTTGYKDLLYLDVASEKKAGKPKRSIHIDGVLYSFVG